MKIEFAMAINSNTDKREIESWAKPINVLSHYNRLERMLHNTFREERYCLEQSSHNVLSHYNHLERMLHNNLKKKGKSNSVKIFLEETTFLDQKSLHAGTHIKGLQKFGLLVRKVQKPLNKIVLRKRD